MSPRRRDGDPLRLGSPEVPGDPDHTAKRKLEGSEFAGYHGAAPADFSGYDRPTWIVENENEITAEYARQRGQQPEIECAYCYQRTRSRSIEGALQWWQTHDCETLFQSEQAGLVYDLTPMLRANRKAAEAA